MAVRRLDLGYLIRPASETGGPQPRVEPVLAYLVQHDQGQPWLERLADFDPRRVFFAHDCSVWEPSRTAIQGG